MTRWTVLAFLAALLWASSAKGQSNELTRILQQSGVSPAGIEIMTQEAAALRARLAAWRREQPRAEAELQSALEARPIDLARVERALRERDRLADALVTARSEPMLRSLRRLSPEDAAIVAPLIAPRPMLDGLPIAPPAPPPPR